MAIAGTAAGGLAAAGAATSIPAGTIHGCVTGTTRTLEHVYVNPTNGTTCPKGSFLVYWNQQGPQGPQGPAGQNAILTVTAQTVVFNWPEGSGWATDNFTRQVTISREHAAPASDCGASATSCWFYTETLADNGHSAPVDGHASPNGSSSDTITAAHITGISMTGGGKLEFYASSNAPNPALVPGTASATPAKPSSTTDWYKLFFPAGTSFGLTSGANVPWLTYDWNYAASVSYYSNAEQKTISCNQTWNDGINPGDDGQGSSDGNITGTCPAP